MKPTNIRTIELSTDFTTIKRGARLMATRIQLQASRDFAFPHKIDAVNRKIKTLDKTDPMYKEMKNSLYTKARKQIIKDLKSPFVIFISDGGSVKKAEYLQKILDDKTGIMLKQFKRNVKSLDREEV